MTKKETIYNALGMIEGAVCVSQKNTREVLMKAIEMIKNAVEEETESVAESEQGCDCNHNWEARELIELFDSSAPLYNKPKFRVKYVCTLCGATEVRDD